MTLWIAANCTEHCSGDANERETLETMSGQIWFSPLCRQGRSALHFRRYESPSTQGSFSALDYIEHNKSRHLLDLREWKGVVSHLNFSVQGKLPIGLPANQSANCTEKWSGVTQIKWEVLEILSGQKWLYIWFWVIKVKIPDIFLDFRCEKNTEKDKWKESKETI